MLLHNSAHVQPSCYYPDPAYLPRHATPPPPHFDIDAFLTHPASYHSHGGPAAAPCPPQQQQQQQTYYSHGASGGTYSQQHHHHHHHHHHAPYFPCSCGCLWKPVQETFLHKILTGKGYQNDAMCLSHRGHHASGKTGDNSFQYHGSPTHGMGADYAMAASCCYSGLSPMAVSAAAFPPSIPGL